MLLLFIISDHYFNVLVIHSLFLHAQDLTQSNFTVRYALPSRSFITTIGAS